jgi:hypothetical protein
MPRDGIAYHVDDLWRDRVRDRLEEIKQNREWLANTSGCPKSMLSELLSGKRQQTTYLPELHEALGWDPPLGPLLSKDDEELLSFARRLDKEQLGRLKERAQMLVEERRKRDRKT